MKSIEETMPLIVESLDFTYARKSTLPSKFVLQGITFSLNPGECLGVIGRNGSGKSTLAKLLSGVLVPDSGSIEARGLVAPLIELGAGFDYEMTAKENILLYGMLLGISYSFLKESADEILSFADLLPFANEPLRTFSSGMIARLGFSIAGFATPNLLIIDEILSVGDQEFAKKSRLKVSELLANSSACVLVSHDFDSIRELTTRTIWLDHGKIREFGQSIEVTDKYMTQL
jgi:ABC-2 type transport system ATP-binding protein